MPSKPVQGRNWWVIFQLIRCSPSCMINLNIHLRLYPYKKKISQGVIQNHGSYFILPKDFGKLRIDFQLLEFRIENFSS